MALVIGGKISTANNIKVVSVAKWDGTIANIGNNTISGSSAAGMPSPEIYGMVKTSTGVYYAAGQRGVYRCDPANINYPYWSQVFYDVSVDVKNIVINPTTNRIYFANSWQVWDLDTTTDTVTLIGTNAQITGNPSALAVDPVTGYVWYGSQFESIESVPALNLAIWNGTAWSDAGGAAAGLANPISALCISSGTVYLGTIVSELWTVTTSGNVWSNKGQIPEGSGGGVITSIVAGSGCIYFSPKQTSVKKWTSGGGFTQVGSSSMIGIQTLVLVGTHLYAGWSGSLPQGYNAAGGVLNEDNLDLAGKGWGVVKCVPGTSDWESFTNEDPSGFPGNIYSLTASGSDLYITGCFDIAYSGAEVTGVRSILMYDSGLTPHGSSGGGQFRKEIGVKLGTLNGEVRKLAYDTTGGLYVLGGFDTAFDYATNTDVAVDGLFYYKNGVVTKVGSNETGYIQITDIGCSPTTGHLYAVGLFTTIGGVAANYVARWDGSSWNALGSGLNGQADVIHFNATGTLFIAGRNFTTAGGITANRIAKWDGSNWTTFGTGFTGISQWPRALFYDQVYNNLYAGGYFTTAGGVSANNIAKWNGTAWVALGTGIGGGTVNALNIQTGDLFLQVGGDFSSAGGSPAYRTATWSRTGSSWTAWPYGTPFQNKGTLKTLVSHAVGTNHGGTFSGFSDASPYATTSDNILYIGWYNAWQPLGGFFLTGINSADRVLTLASGPDTTNPVQKDPQIYMIFQSQEDFASNRRTMVWGAAADDTGPLQYRAYYSTNSALDSVAEILANGTALNTYSSGQTVVVNAPTENIYYYNVLTKDGAGNVAAVHTKLPYDFRAPAQGYWPNVTVGSVVGTTATVNWHKAQDIIPESLTIRNYGMWNEWGDYDSSMGATAPIASMLTGNSSYTGNVGSAYFDSTRTVICLDSYTSNNFPNQEIGSYYSSTIRHNNTTDYTVDSIDVEYGVIYLAASYGDISATFTPYNDQIRIGYRVYTLRLPEGTFPNGMTSDSNTRFQSYNDANDGLAVTITISGHTYNVTIDGGVPNGFQLMNGQPSNSESSLIVGATIGFTFWSDYSHQMYQFAKNGVPYTGLVAKFSGIPYSYYNGTPSSYYDEGLGSTLISMGDPSPNSFNTIEILDGSGNVTHTYNAYYDQNQGAAILDSSYGDVTSILSASAGYRYAMYGSVSPHVYYINPTTHEAMLFGGYSFPQFGVPSPVTAGIMTYTGIQYLLYASTSDAMNTVPDIEAHGTAIGSYENDIETKTVTGLLPLTKYYFNVITQSATGGYKNAYQKVSATTSTSGVIDTITPGNAEVTGAVTWGTGSALTLATDGNVSPTGDLTLDITDLGQITASGATRFIKVDAGGSIRIKNRKKITVRPKTKYRLKIKV